MKRYRDRFTSDGAALAGAPLSSSDQGNADAKVDTVAKFSLTLENTARCRWRPAITGGGTVVLRWPTAATTAGTAFWEDLKTMLASGWLDAFIGKTRATVAEVQVLTVWPEQDWL